jgi:hypothetical protein
MSDADTDAEDLIARLAGGLAPADREAFRQAAETALAQLSSTCLGPGSIYRTVAPLWRKYFHPPATPVTTWDQGRLTNKLVNEPALGRSLNRAWAATQLQAHRERVAEHFLQQFGFEVYLPRVRRHRIRWRRRIEYFTPYFRVTASPASRYLPPASSVARSKHSSAMVNGTHSKRLSPRPRRPPRMCGQPLIGCGDGERTKPNASAKKSGRNITSASHPKTSKSVCTS